MVITPAVFLDEDFRGTNNQRINAFALYSAVSTIMRISPNADLKNITGLKWEAYLAYLDDVLVLNRTFDDHLKCLAQMFLRFHQAGMKISPAKCRFLRKEVTYLGHSQSAAGIHPDMRLTETHIMAVLSGPSRRLPHHYADLRKRGQYSFGHEKPT
uniref:Reverse transcriptase domain-containing protein n=1 Tax=Trichuris muris TaxID=70415 RepID=A0A5S6R0G4_TRIMR